MVKVADLLEQARESISPNVVFAAPYDKNGVTVIPAARIMGGAGGGEGEAPSDEAGEGSERGRATGSGAGFGMSGGPAGAYVIKGDDVKWVPAVDVNRLILGFQIVMIVFFLAVRSIAKSRTRAHVTDDPTSA